MTTTTSTPIAESPVLHGAERFGQLALIGAPALWLVAWTIMRLDGHNGPGSSWMAAHLVWLFAYTLFGVLAIATMRTGGSAGSRGGRRLELAAVSLTTAGAVAFVSQMIVDLAVGFRAGTGNEMDHLYDHVLATPGVELGLFQLGPASFYFGLLLLTVSAAMYRHVPMLSPVTVALGSALIVIGREGPDTIRPMEGLGMVVLWLGIAAAWHQSDSAN